MTTARSMEQVRNDCGIASKASVYGTVLGRCDRIAGVSVHDAGVPPSDRRRQSEVLELIPKAIATRDTESSAPRAD